jgi:uncharacterized protein (TIGR01777 family)
MDVAITGASGLIGTALAAGLRASGDRVRPLVRGQSRRSDQPGAVRWDPAAGTIDAEGLAGVDVVVHLAGAGIGDRRLTAARRQVVLESRTEGTALIARTLAAMEAPPRVLVSGSAVGFYGSRGDEVLTERSAAGDDFVADLVEAWEAAAQPALDAGIRTVFLRTAPVLSGRGGILPRMALPFRLYVGGRIGSGRQWMSWISLEDVVGIVRFVIGREDIRGPVNVAAPGPVTNAEMTAALGRALHRPTLLPVPPVALRLALGRDRTDSLLLVSQRVMPEALTEAGYAFVNPGIDDALAAAFGGKT